MNKKYLGKWAILGSKILKYHLNSNRSKTCQIFTYKNLRSQKIGKQGGFLIKNLDMKKCQYILQGLHKHRILFREPNICYAIF